jgi:hypothetical protein
MSFQRRQELATLDVIGAHGPVLMDWPKDYGQVEHSLAGKQEQVRSSAPRPNKKKEMYDIHSKWFG